MAEKQEEKKTGQSYLKLAQAIREMNRKESEKEEPTYQVQISKAINKMKEDKGESSQIYEEAYNLIKDILDRVRNNESFDYQQVALVIRKMVDQVCLGGHELLAITDRSSLENYLWCHSVNVCILSLLIGMTLGYNKSKLQELGIAAYLHDLGMIRVLDLVETSKPLDENEFNEVKKHTNYSFNILNGFKDDVMQLAALVAHQNHERFDGSGYPDRIKGEDIHEYSQIVALADVYEAMTHPRPYRDRFFSHDGIKEILKRAAQFSSLAIKALIKRISLYPVSTWVKLNTDEVGKVVEVHEDYPLRPVVNVVFD
ncbi:MAG: HD-GYP domain-containing protein, partial [Candidatus Omnitrophota bacterium]|nr:HD-GYP domain-containing protein [Candidatus Omnitrophota bacterium]